METKPVSFVTCLTADIFMNKLAVTAWNRFPLVVWIVLEAWTSSPLL